mgnify:CR=1 FL=1
MIKIEIFFFSGTLGDTLHKIIHPIFCSQIVNHKTVIVITAPKFCIATFQKDRIQPFSVQKNLLIFLLFFSEKQKITDQCRTVEIQRTLDIFGSNESPITAFKNENDIVILQPKEIYMVRVENKDTIIYGKEHRYRSRKRLYEMQQQLGAGFMQISKSTLVNLSYMSNVEAGFSGTLLLKLKNGCKDYVSRKYLPEFKKYLGL